MPLIETLERLCKIPSNRPTVAFCIFPTISCIVVNTVCNYFWSPRILNLCKCIQIDLYFLYKPQVVNLSCLFQTNSSYSATCGLEIFSLERLILFSWAENVCMHKTEHIRVSTWFYTRLWETFRAVYWFQSVYTLHTFLCV